MTKTTTPKAAVNCVQQAFLSNIKDGKARPYKEVGHHRVRDWLAENGLITVSTKGEVKITPAGKKAIA